MDKVDKDKIIFRYNKRLEKYGYDIRTLASGTQVRRDIRFKILTEVGIVSGSEILDLGCGFGDYFQYLESQDINVKYTGYDINPKLIEIAKKKFSKPFFQVKDIQNENFPEFDYIVSTSAFNLKLNKKDNYLFAEEILKLCYRHARKGVAIDFMSSYVDYKVPKAFYYEPETIFMISKKITKRVCLRHDYPLFEFCIYLFPDFKSWK